MSLSSYTPSASSVGAGDEDVGLLAVNWPQPSISGYGMATRVAAPGTVDVGETRGAGLEPTGPYVTADGTPTVVTGA